MVFMLHVFAEQICLQLINVVSLPSYHSVVFNHDVLRGRNILRFFFIIIFVPFSSKLMSVQKIMRIFIFILGHRFLKSYLSSMLIELPFRRRVKDRNKIYFFLAFGA